MNLFARKDIVEIAKLYIKNSTVQSIYITTNGSLPDRVESFAKKITDFEKNVELTFQISIQMIFLKNTTKLERLIIYLKAA